MEIDQNFPYIAGVYGVAVVIMLSIFLISLKTLRQKKKDYDRLKKKI